MLHAFHFSACGTERRGVASPEISKTTLQEDFRGKLIIFSTT